ncbi:thiamine phosphate synthase [Dietzia cinnamea]|uniref:thiamine phosphate synthase n=1 Tax=Dietzia cinnamea TaxID=321318 RepID=UPI0021B089D9|nr:thiamine phosphate synthase [Dietzia cinnamea]MCT1712939.1 thiamine phosphate synthase [Dietzia cinnamea]MCT2062480.1 thiamine phosphate synthase [Dietzia cinnamea]MCT2235484.1 thiamine phosphate synthase [Dietzia cinnamea]MCT2299465.1 thiamine phosphate synthase [Dietzia cinnamea]
MTARADRLRARLADARLYLCIDARRHLDDDARAQGWTGDFPALRRDVTAALAGGVDIVQLRDKNSPGDRDLGPLEAGHELRALAVMRDVCDAHGALLSVNDRADVAVAAGADVLHVGQDDLPVEWARRIVGDDMILGISCHADDEVDAAAANPVVDYFCTGPVWPTPTKPGRHAPGLGLVRHAAGLGGGPAAAPKPWFAIGGIDPDTLPEVLAAGASRVVVVRAITAAPDPTAAARELRAALA